MKHAVTAGLQLGINMTKIPPYSQSLNEAEHVADRAFAAGRVHLLEKSAPESEPISAWKARSGARTRARSAGRASSSRATPRRAGSTRSDLTVASAPRSRAANDPRRRPAAEEAGQADLAHGLAAERRAHPDEHDRKARREHRRVGRRHHMLQHDDELQRRASDHGQELAPQREPRATDQRLQSAVDRRRHATATIKINLELATKSLISV